MNRSVDPAKKNEQILLDLLKIETNKYCADCGQKGTRWASWNIGVFLCIRCGGLHRSLGTHISKVKSVTLDKWTDEQVESIKSKGNAKVNMVYNPNADKHPFPTFSGDMENYIRDKYERKLFMSGSSGSSGPISLKSSSVEKYKNDLMNSQFLSESNDIVTHAFKTSSSDSAGSNYSKQLTLLSEMGFADAEFNYKTLKAANGNMQEALEIIVAANQKQKRKTVDRNIFDEIEEVKPTPKTTANPIDETGGTFKSPPPMHMDDWGFDNSVATKNIKNEEVLVIAEFESHVEVEKPKPTDINNNKPSNSSNPWGEDFVEDSSIEKDSKAKEDPFDSYKAFRSTADTYFDNPW